MTRNVVRGVSEMYGLKLVRVLLGSVALLLPAVLAAQQPPRITGISHVTLYADNMAQSRAFYGELLGWEPVSPSGSGAGPRFYANHEQYVELLPPPVEGQLHRMDRVSVHNRYRGVAFAGRSHARALWCRHPSRWSKHRKPLKLPAVLMIRRGIRWSSRSRDREWWHHRRRHLHGA